MINLRETLAATEADGHGTDRGFESVGAWQQDAPAPGVREADDQAADDFRAPRGLAKGLVLGCCCWAVVGLLIWLI